MQDLRVPGGTTVAVPLLKIKVLETNLDIQRKFCFTQDEDPDESNKKTRESPEGSLHVGSTRPTD